jgi:hypothetical protein
VQGCITSRSNADIQQFIERQISMVGRSFMASKLVLWFICRAVLRPSPGLRGELTPQFSAGWPVLAAIVVSMTMRLGEEDGRA